VSTGLDRNQAKFQYYVNLSLPILVLYTGVLIVFNLLGNGLLLEEDEADSVVQYDENTIFVILGFLLISTIMFYIVFFKLKSIGIRAIYGISLGSIFLFSISEALFLLSEDSELSNSDYGLILLLVTLPVFSILFFFVYLTAKPILFIRNWGVTISALLFGRMLALYIDLATLVAFGILISVYDFWSVFRGPLSRYFGRPTSNKTHNSTNSAPLLGLSEDEINRVVQNACRRGLPVFIVPEQNIMIGIGDLLLYSVLMYRAYFEWGFLSTLLTLVTILFGSFVTFWLLKRISPLPGLPIPVLLTLILFFGFEFLS